METFSFSPPINLLGEGNWLLAELSLEANNSVLKITNENNTFSISTPDYRFSRGSAETIMRLQKLLEIRHNIDIEIHVEEVRKRGNQTKTRDNIWKLSDPDTRKKRELKN